MDDEQDAGLGALPETSAYCPVCGEMFATSAARCPRCGARRRDPPQLDVASLAAVLTDLPRVREVAGLDEPAYAALRRTYEGWLRERRPAPEPAVSAAPARQAGVAGPAPVPRATGPTFGQWTAARQADILLYLGAFLLSIAAFILVGYQGYALDGAVRFIVLLGYTAGFLVLGLCLPRWRRVREAGAVFLALGAILVPVNFFALRTLVLGPSTVPSSVLWLVGSGVTAALYLTLGLRGFGRLYLWIGGVATVTGWAALEAVLTLPPQWSGVWFVGAAATVNAVWAMTRLPGRRAIEICCIAIGALALLFAQLFATFDRTDSAQLPLTYALATVGLVFCGYRRDWLSRASLPSLPPLPPLLALTAFTTCWSAFGLQWVWFACFAAGAAAGYLALAELDEPRRSAWRWTALVSGGVALGWAQLGVEIGAAPAALPATYALLTGAAAWDGVRRRDTSLALLPLLAALTASTALWAAGVPAAWWGYP